MKKIKTFLVLTVLALTMPNGMSAGNAIDSLQMKARLGYNLGGTAPVGIPATIRSIDAYRLTPSLMVSFDVMLPLQQNWGRRRFTVEVLRECTIV